MFLLYEYIPKSVFHKKNNIAIIFIVFVELGTDAAANAALAFTFGTQSISRFWEIKVTQLECTNRSKPPSGCLQYFTGTTGRIETFNFQNSGTPQHLHDQK